MIKTLKKLITLSLACCRLGNEGMRLVVKAVASHPSLSNFDLSDNELAGNGGNDILM